MNLPTILEDLDDLPPTPQILPRLQELLRDANADQSDLVALLRVDSGLTARIIRMANSAYFGAHAPSENISDAVARLGFNDVYRVTSLAVTGQLLGAALPAYRLKAGELAERSLACATVLSSFESSPLEPLDRETKYTVGLLHAAGKIVVNHYFLRRGLEVYSENPEHEITPEEERDLLGFDHAKAGAELLRKWRFPERICSAILHQLEPLQASQSPVLTAQLRIATLSLPQVRDDSAIGKTPVFSGDPGLLLQAGIDEEAYVSAVETARDAFGKTRTLMRSA